MAFAALGAISTACASGAVPRPFPVVAATPPPAPAPPPSVARFTRQAVIDAALGLRGTPYQYRGSDPRGFDCSGFVQYVFGRVGVALPRDVKEQFDAGTPVDRAGIEPGDLIFFTTVAPGASHVGLAVGGDQFVHAPSSNGVVRIERLNADYWSRRFVGARRIE